MRGQDLVDDGAERAGVGDLRQALAGDDGSRPSSPERYIFSNTSLAILPLIVPSSISASSPARCAGRIGTGGDGLVVVAPGISRSSSFSTQLATILGWA